MVRFETSGRVREGWQSAMHRVPANGCARGVLHGKTGPRKTGCTRFSGAQGSGQAVSRKLLFPRMVRAPKSWAGGREINSRRKHNLNNRKTFCCENTRENGFGGVKSGKKRKDEHFQTPGKPANGFAEMYYFSAFKKRLRKKRARFWFELSNAHSTPSSLANCL